MRYGITVANFGSYASPRSLAELAPEAEESAWDGFFVWDHISPAASEGTPMADPWILLAAIAASTERMRLGTMITPVPRRQPWKLARETVTLDHLSNGRLVLGVGLGFPPEEYSIFGEDADALTRAAKLDEGLEVLAGLWSGAPFRHKGAHYRVDETAFLPRPVQEPRIPVWVAGALPNRAPFRRAARWDGVFPIRSDIMPLTPAEVRDVAGYVRSHRDSDESVDVVLSGESWGDGPSSGRSRCALMRKPVRPGGSRH